MSYSKVLFGLSLLSLVAACRDDSPGNADPDTERPTISLVKSTPPLHEGIICKKQETKVITAITGNMLALDLFFSDNHNLNEYRLDIHSNFDCHEHGRLKGTSWRVLKVEDISGKEKDMEELIPIPESASAGAYHVQIQCIDEVGNEAIPLIFSLLVENAIDSSPPHFTLSQPASSSVTIAKGSELYFKGEVTDNHSMGGGKVEISYIDPKGSEYFPVQHIYPEGQGKTATFDLSFTIPAFSKSGRHDFSVKVYDKYNNEANKSIEVNLF